MRKFFGQIEEVFCALLLLIMAVVAFLNVCVRYFTNYSFAFTEEIEVAGLVYLTLFGAAAAFKRGLHLGIAFVKRRFSPKIQAGLTVFAAVLSLGLFLTIAYYSIIQIKDERLLGTTSEALQIPQWIYTMAIPIGIFFITVRILEYTWDSVKEGFRKDL
ncbi:TRAP transporter small permease [Thermodesulforhabdus norvegica]|uniref:TRAP-type C4-dicarboxylate transport system, small permease component n=1 Tax=Thermodesulforhabdus norvegica TaxID=39841 RepID=A0A1I4RLR4_9BACT|nr:TRAP transporter small permease [Thermodesulforhabdus norvegica]SFM53174.1 TRAP-type C4-dicarboxylate transport system, small permease component [Thermodesulforhabdus norvegica]